MTAPDRETPEAVAFRLGKQFCEHIANDSDSEICFKVGAIIRSRDALASLLPYVGHWPGCGTEERGECTCGLAEIQAALGRGE